MELEDINYKLIIISTNQLLITHKYGMICSPSVCFESVPVTGKIGGSDQLSTGIVSLPTGNRRSFTWKRINKESTMVLPSASQRKGDNFQNCTEHFGEETELAFGVGKRRVWRRKRLG